MGSLQKQFVNHFGLDLKSNDIVRPTEFASKVKNAQYKKNGNVGKRRGYRGAADSAGGLGMGLYNRIQPSDGKLVPELLAVDGDLQKLNEASFTVTYAGSEASVIYEIFMDEETQTYKAQITEDVTLVMDEDLGVGIDEASPVTLADLKATVDAITDFTATIVGDDTTPAAYLDFLRSENLAAGDVASTARYWTEVNKTVTSPFSGAVTNQADDDFENASFEQLNNVLFIATGYDALQKYDGQTVYNAGVPEGVIPTTALGIAGLLTSATGYRHRIVYTQFDAVGNIVEGQPSGVSTPDLTPTAESIDVTVTNIEDGTGFNTNCAIVDGAQGPVNTITVDDGSAGAHTMKAGDRAYFFDSVSGNHVTRNVTSVAGTTITVDGAAVTVADNAVISNNLRIGIYRNLDGGTTSFLVAEIPNDSFTTTQVYNDNIPDASLGIELIDPVFRRDLPPIGRYVSKYNNQLFVAGDPDNQNLAYWTPPEKPENFSIALLNARFQSKNGDPISGLKQDNEVMAVFEKRATHILSGDLANLNIRIDILNEDIGCISNGSIQEVRGSLYFLSDRGVWAVTSGQQPRDNSERIEPIFDVDITLPENEIKRLKRSVAVNFRSKEQYILFLPAETPRAPKVESNGFSQIVTEDYFRNAWFLWDNMNMGGGAVIFKDMLYFTEKRFSTTSSVVENYLYIQQDRGDAWDYEDNIDPIDCEYGTAWYHMGEPSIFKKYLRFKAFGIEDTEANAFTIDVDIERDFVSDLIIGQFTLDYATGQEGYGIASYGVAPYGDPTDPNRKFKIGPIKSKALRFIMKNSEHKQNIDISGWEIEFVPAYRRELKE